MLLHTSAIKYAKACMHMNNRNKIKHSEAVYVEGDHESSEVEQHENETDVEKGDNL